jgi:hypothetical protein
MTRNSIVSGIAGMACLISSAAMAQSAGTFAGTSLDGGTISLTVTKVGSVFTVTTVNVNFQAACKKTGLTTNEGWGFFLGDDISSGSTDFTSNNDYYYITGSMHFAGHTVIKGTITSYTAVFIPGVTPPAKSQFCVSAKQSFTLTKTAPGRVQPLPSNVDTGRLKPVR